ncbi:TOX high mobility group box family member 4-like [Heptranchias perlo]|uniref:TOX high mobility group box family member 4-like n=1 Tax=Heptranchias perlo TaxID=212740 RepID=UPI00355A7EEC
MMIGDFGSVIFCADAVTRSLLLRFFSQIYKRKTEAAKKEYLKALASYRASLVSKTAADSSETDALQTVQQTLASTTLSPALLVTPAPSQPAAPSPPVQPSAPRALAPRQDSVTTRHMASVSQSLLTVLPATLRLGTPAPQLVQVQLPIVGPPQLTQVRLQRLQPPPPLQQKPPPPLQAMPPHPPPLQPKLRQGIPQPPPLQVQIIQLQQLAPAHLQPAPAPPPPAIAPCPHPRLALPEQSPALPEVITQEESPPQADVELVSSSPTPPSEASSTPLLCVRTGCTNCPVSSTDWDSEYCSNECVVSHCR